MLDKLEETKVFVPLIGSKATTTEKEKDIFRGKCDSPSKLPKEKKDVKKEEEERRMLFQGIKKVQFGVYSNVEELMSTQSFQAQFNEQTCRTKDEKAEVKKLRIKLGLNSVQGQMLCKKLQVQRFQELVDWFICTCNEHGIKWVSGQLQ